jgi:hypothetical protein
MKQRLWTFLIGLAPLLAGAQTVYDPTHSNYETIINSGYHEFKGQDYSLILYNQSANSQVRAMATHSILLPQGVTIENLSGNAYFEASIIPGLVKVADMNGNWLPQKFSRFEIGTSVPAATATAIDNFLSTGTGLNPYDPDQLKLECIFTHGANSYTRYGFYYKDFMPNPDGSWTELPTNYPFRVRFAPPEIGWFDFTMKLFDHGTSIQQFTGRFWVGAGDDRGHLIMANGLQRKMMFQNGQIFFGIGQNVAYAEPDFAFPCCIASHYTYEDQRSYIEDLADNEGNFVRIRLDPWSNPLVSQQREFFPSDPTPKSLQRCVSDWTHNQSHMWEFDQTLGLCEERDVYIMLNILQDQYFSMYDRYLNTHAWQSNPYSTLTSPDLQGIDAFFRDHVNRDEFKKLLFYLAARWGYSKHLALWEIVNEVENLGEYQYFDPDGKPKEATLWGNNSNDFRNVVDDWICEMKSTLELYYPWHPTTSGSTGERDSENGMYDLYRRKPECLNVWSSNSYTSQVGSDHQHSDADYNTRYPVSVGYYNHFKPFIFGETGEQVDVDDNCGGLINFDALYDRGFHNSLWASIFSGSIATCLNWSDWKSNYVDHRINFRELNDFVSRIDWSRTYVPGKYEHEDGQKKLFTYYLRSTDGERIYGWVKNSSSYWKNDVTIPETVRMCAQNALQFWDALNPYTIEDNWNNPDAIVDDLSWNDLYDIRLYNTYFNPSYNVQLESKVGSVNINGRLKFRRRSTFDIVYPWYPDYAFECRKIGSISRFCIEDTNSELSENSKNPPQFENKVIIITEFYDVSGRLVYKTDGQVDKLEGAFPNGIYLRKQTNNYGEIKCEKIIYE